MTSYDSLLINLIVGVPIKPSIAGVSIETSIIKNTHLLIYFLVSKIVNNLLIYFLVSKIVNNLNSTNN